MTGDKSTGVLLNEAMTHVSSLVRNEVDLARAEINQNLSKAAVAIGLIVGAAVVALTALNVLSAALVVGLTNAGLDGGWAALIVGLVFAVVAYLMAKSGTDNLKLTSLAPTRAARNIVRDAEAVKETLQ